MATTTNFGWETPDDTDLVKDGAAAIRTALGGVDTSFVDLKGGTTGQLLAKASNTDLDYTWVAPTTGDITGVSVTSPITGGGTSGDVTIGISSSAVVPSQTGNAGKYLTTDGSTSSWGTIATGGLAVSQIATGTLSGSSLSVSSLSSYDQVEFFIWNADATSDCELMFRINSNSGSNYTQGPLIQSGSTTDYTYVPTATDLTLTYNSTFGNNTAEQMCYVRFNNCKSTGFTTINYVSYYRNASNVGYSQWGNGVYRVAEAVSSIQFLPSTGSFTGGDYRVYAG